jgi:hypothetical protein
LQNYREDERIEEVLYFLLSFWTSKNFFLIKNTTSISLTSNNLILETLKMIKPLMLRRKSLNSNIEELSILNKIMKEEIKE